MPYVNIPPSNLIGSIARLVGKIEGDISGKVLAQAGGLESIFKSEGCPADLGKIRRKKDGLSNALSSIDGRMNKFRSLPKKLKGPVKGLKAALKIILALPIPQAVPPGIGLPMNLSMKFADILHLLKEFIRQLGDDIDGLEVVLSGPAGSLKSIQRLMDNVEFALKTCEIERALQLQLEAGKLDVKELEDLGLAEEGKLIVSNLSPKMLNRGFTLDDRSVKEVSQETGFTEREVYKEIRKTNINKLTPEQRSQLSITDTPNAAGISNTAGNTNNSTTGGIDNLTVNNLNSLTTPNQAKLELLELLHKLQGSNIPDQIKNDIKNLSDSYVDKPEEKRGENTKFKHYGPNGTLYNLEIVQDKDSPAIAPLRFAIAKNPSNVVVLKGGKSFSSSTDILLDEIKFRIDNQLP